MLSFEQLNYLYGYLEIKNSKDGDEEIKSIVKLLEKELNELVDKNSKKEK